VDLDALLRDGPAAGIYFICLDETPARLPPECRQALVELSEDAGAVVAHVHRPGRVVSGAAPDVVAPQVTERASRAMAPVSEAGTRTASEALPDSVRFLQIAGLEPPTAAQVRSRWASAGRTTRALLGVRADGPFTLDLIQGPHLLVAGTTGSGKSEFLQTLVASLAVANRPDAMNFVLVDYKGGAAFRACEPLPHTVGMVTDLDEFAVDRALTSLRAELQRRKTVLCEADKPNIGQYWDALPAMPGADPLPRLVIVVDEFAVMAEQLPSQLRSLVDIGMQGRSLGIHLVLATQRPAGVVTADLRANINLRVALRVTSPEDSRDVIETVDAARIPAENSAGRAYAWLGGGRPVAFQAARVGGLRPGVVPANSAATVAPFGWEALGRPLPRAGEAKPDPSDPTDLSTLVAAIKAAGQEEGIAPQHTPWQPPLPDLLTLGQAPRLAGPGTPALAAGPPPLVFGAVDHPRTQQQVPAALDVVRGGHLLVAGAPQSGRTTLLRTLAGCLAAQVSPDDVHLYAIDCGGGLAALSALAHCGAVVTPAEPDRVDRLLARLTREVAHRTRLMSAGGHGDLTEYRQALPAAGRPPFLLVFVDRYDAFVTALGGVDNGRLVSDLQRLIRDGLAAGTRAVVTGDRSLLLGPLAGLAEDKIVLRMADRNDYGIVGLSPKAMPAKVPSGRGFRVPGGDMLQVAVLSDEAQGAAQNQALRALAARQPRPAARAFRVDALPPMITYEQACELPPGGDGVLVGVGGDDLSQVRADTPALLVLGQPRSGRSTALAVQARSLATAGAPVVLVTPRRSLLATAVGPAGVALRLESAGAEAAAQLRAALADGGPAVIVVDDADQLTDTPLGEELTAVCRGIRDSAHRLLAAAVPDSATGFRGLVPELAKAKCGLVLEPATPNDGAPFGARLAASVLASGTPLRGAFVHYGTVVAVQVPSIGNSVTEPVRSGADQP
jgi:S-DNA-T family DNA segregation ATPase FtsK/SpoIIIE